MIDVVSAVSAATSVETPTAIDLADSQHLPVSPAPGFGVRDLLTGVFSDLVAFLERNSGEAASAMYC